MIWPDPTHQHTHQTIHPPMGGEVSTDFKSSNRIEISQLVQVLLNFDWFRGSPLGGGGGWMWVGGGERVPPTHMHMHIWHHREFPGISPMGVAICMKLSCLPCMHVHACVCMCMCAYMCMCTCVGAPPNHLPPPRAAGSHKHQNSITLKLIEIIQFCLKILYLWTFLNSYRL